jgi:replicative DNA helicase Mcm
MNTNHELLETVAQFYRDYYREDIAKLAQSYPKDQTSLWIDYRDVWRYNPNLADDLREQPDELLPHFEEAVDMVDIPLDVSLDGVSVRVFNLNDEHVYSPGELRNDQPTNYVGITGILERVTTTSDLPEVVVFECSRCGSLTRIEQQTSTQELQEPHECNGCERQGPFTINHDQSEWSDYAKLRIESSPDSAQESEGKVVGFALDDLIDEGGEGGLLSRAGEPVTVYGILRRQQKTGTGENNLLFDHVLDARAVEFDRDDETVDVAAHRDEFTELANRDDAIDLFAESIAPQLHTTEAWDAAMEFAVAYLFGAPRVDIHNGPTYRGDLHFLMITGFGMGKSTFKEDIEAYSPKCISKSTTALSSGVGLTAAAVKDDFGAGQWTIKPGLLVRANGGHLLLDEIDKGPDELTEMNDALEGEQVVDVEKAGQSATYHSRTAVMAMGNPVEGRFNSHEAIAHQLGIKQSLLSRFDGIVTMRDEADQEQDKRIAETYGKSYTEAQEAEFGERDEFDQLERPVPIDTGQAWIQYARDNVDPILRYEQFEELEEWYANEVRQLNQTFAEEGEGGDMPVPTTVRDLATAVKMSIAFARVELRDEVTHENVARAKRLTKALVAQKWDGEQFNDPRSESQQERVESVIDAVRRLDDGDDVEIDEIYERVNIPNHKIDKQIEGLMSSGRLIEPQTGEYRLA